MTISMHKNDLESMTRFTSFNDEPLDSHIYQNFSIDNNNNETPKHTINSMFESGKKYDSGLEILSPQSDKSLTNIFANSPDDYPDNNGNHFSTMTLPYHSNENIIENKWASLNVNNNNSNYNSDEATHRIIEFKSSGTEKKSKTKIIIYRNEMGKFQHLTIQDFRLPDCPIGVKRSNTFSHDRDNKENVTTPLNAFHSTENLPYDHKYKFSANSIGNYPPYNSCSDLFQLPQNFESHSENLNNLEPKSTLKQRILSGICSCLRPMCKLLSKNVYCEEDENNNSCDTGCVVDDIPSKSEDWQFSLVAFNDLTYISSGAEGSVYTAILNGVKVALKKVSKEKDVQIENLLKLNHENIVRFIGICTDNPFYIVMEYCSEGQLYQWLRREMDISVHDVISWAKQLCKGMEYLHFNDIIHRDLKSPNALITENKILKIIDFGFGKCCPENVILNSFVGTVAWMAPEVIREEGHTKKIDTWSFGVVLWEMITRQIPYFGVETVTIIYGVGQQCLSLPMYDSFPQEIKKILNQCWKHNPDDRPSFEEILNNFENYFEELQTFDQEKFNSLQAEWKSQIESCFQNMTQARISTSKVEAELIRRRTKELKDAKDIKHLYNEKLMRADKLIELLTKCLNAVEKERLRNDGEWKLIQSWKKTLRLQNSPRDNRAEFSSLGNSPPVQSSIPLKIYKSPTIKSNKKPVVGSEKIQNRHSMLESSHPDKHNLKVRRKHSAPISKDKTSFYYPSILKRTSQCINNKVLKGKAKRKSISCETLYNIPKESNNQLKQTNKRHSNPLKDIHFSTLPQLDRINAHNDPHGGNINPSFESSHDSLTGINVIKNYNKNMQQLVYFGPSASISDLNLSSDTTTESSNSMLNPPIVRRNILEDSITECPHMEEDFCERTNETGEMCTLDLPTTGSPVMIRERSGRKGNNSKDSFNCKDSLDYTLTDSQNHIADSINEKEKIAQKLIACNFLANVMPQVDSSSDEFNVQIDFKSKKQIGKTSFEGKNMSLWSPEHRSKCN